MKSSKLCTLFTSSIKFNTHILKLYLHTFLRNVAFCQCRQCLLNKKISTHLLTILQFNQLYIYNIYVFASLFSTSLQYNKKKTLLKVHHYQHRALLYRSCFRHNTGEVVKSFTDNVGFRFCYDETCGSPLAIIL